MYNGYRPIEKRVYLGETKQMSFSLQKQYVKDKELYIEAGAGMGSTMTLAVAAGGYYANFNVELDYYFGFQKSPAIYWNYTGEFHDYAPEVSTYSPSLILLCKMGYGIIVGSRYKITPQVGYRFTKLSSNNGYLRGANCKAITIGLRAYYAISSNFGISLTPEYAIGVAKSDGFKILSDVTSKIKNMGEGFNAKFALDWTFQ